LINGYLVEGVDINGPLNPVGGSVEASKVITTPAKVVIEAVKNRGELMQHEVEEREGARVGEWA
jgi:hypothetical protein